MPTDYIKWLRDKVGHELVFLNFSVGILTNDKGDILLQRRADKGTWGLIGGALELGESSVQALKREFFEEANIQVEPVRLLNVYTRFQDTYPNGDVAQTIGFLYAVKAVADFDIVGIANDETLELAFFSKEALENIELVNAQHALMIQEYFDDAFKLGH